MVSATLVGPFIHDPIAGLSGGERSDALGAFGDSWFRAMVSASGLSVLTESLDRSKVDISVREPSGGVVNFQVKTTEGPNFDGGYLKYDLDIETYNKLRQYTADSYLIVVAVDRRMSLPWTGHTSMGSVVRATVHLQKMGGQPVVANTATTRLSLPADRLVTPHLIRHVCGW